MSSSAKNQEGSWTEIVVVYVALMALLGLAVGATYLDLGSTLALVVALGIAAAKTGVIMVYYMHLKYRTKMVWMFAASGIVWLLLLFGLGLSDYLTRWWILVGQ